MTARLEPGRLHVLTDASLQDRFSHAELCGLAADGGADAVQFREKRGWETARLVAEARRMRELLADRGVRLIVNDRVDVARVAGADGVHLGDSDPSPGAARRLLGPACLIGRTVHGLEQARAERSAPVDYLGVGPVFGTSSKSARPALGLVELRRIVDASGLPVIAIGNIDAQRVAEVLAAGAHGVAVLSAVVLRPDPAAEVARIRESIDRFLREGRDGRHAGLAG